MRSKYISIVFGALGLSLSANAQFVEVGNNTVSDYNQGPIYRSSASSTLDYNRHSYLLTASELGLPGGSTIDSVQFYKTTTGKLNVLGDATFEMYMENTGATSYSSGDIWSNITASGTQVVNRIFNFNLPYPFIPGNLPDVAGWVSFPITPYVYTGNTLKVSVSWDCSALTSGNPTDGAISWWQDGGVTDKTIGAASSTPVVSLPNTGTYVGRRPVMRIYYTPPAIVNDDAGVASIDSPTGLIAPGAQPLNVTLQNFGANSLASVNVFYNLNGTTFGPISWPGTGLPLASGATEANVTIASPTFVLGTNNLKVWTSAPNGLSDNNVFNDTAYATLEACNVLGGTYTINAGGGGDYVSLNAAYAAMLSCGINAPVVFNVAPGSGPYNERLVMTPVAGASSTNTITFNGNGETWEWGTSTSADRAACLIEGATDITVNDFVFDMNGQYGHGIHMWQDAQRIAITNNTFNHPDNNTSSFHVGITASNSLTSSTSTGVSNADSVTIQGNTIRNAYYGIRINGSTNIRDRAYLIQDNTILDTYFYSMYLHYIVASTIDGNEITAGARTGSTTTQCGIYSSNTANCTFTNNYIHELLNPNVSSTTSSAYGMYFTGGVNDFQTRVENNIISNISNPNGTSGTYYGIYMSSQDSVYVFHNTVIEDVPTWTGSSAQYGLYISSTDQTGSQVRSNIINLNRPSTSTANYAIFFQESTPALYPDSSEYNALYNGSGVLARLNVTNYNTILDWQATGYDLSSVEELAMPAGFGDFTPTNANINDLGDPGVIVALDYNGATRPLGVNPDPGAIEFEPPPIDASLSWVAPVQPAAAGNNVVTVNLANSSGSTQNITSANLTYTDGVNPPVTEVFGPFSIAPGADLNVNFVAPYNLVTASNLRGWINTVNGAMDPVAGNDTTATISICPGLSGGSYTIGATGDYPTIAAAAAALDCGIAGPVVFNVLAASGPYTDRVVINEIAGSSSTNTITFNGNGEMLQWNSSVSAERHAWLVNGTDFLTIDNFVIDVPTGPTSPSTYGHAIHLINETNNVHITNNTITCAVGSTSSLYAAIVASGSLTSATTSGSNADSLVIEGNVISGGYYGIRLNGTSTSLDSNNVIRNNVVQDFANWGIYGFYQENGKIIGNDVHRLNNGTGTAYMIYLSTGCTGMLVDGNRVHNPLGFSPGTSSTCYGFYVVSADATVSNPNIFQNNLLYGFDNGGTATTYAFYMSGSDHCKIWHNTIVLDHTALTSGTVYAIYQTTSAADGLEVRNNIVSISSSGTGTKRCLYYSSTSNTVVSDHNDVVMASTAGSANWTGTYGSSNYATLLDWQGANSNAFDQNSVDADPTFVDPTSDLTPTSGSVNDLCPATVLVAHDFNGVPRPLGVAPDMGAIEFTPPTLDASISWVAPVNPVAAGPATVIVNIDNAVSSIPNISSLNMTYTDGVNPPVTQAFTSLAIAPGTSGQISFTTPFAITNSHTLRAWINTVNGVVDAFQTNDTTNFQSICTSLSGTYVIDQGGSGDYLTIADFANALSVCGISGPVTANVLAGSGPYTDRVVIASIPGSSSTNTVTLNGNGDTLRWETSISAERAALLLDAASYVTIDDLVVFIPDASSFGVGIQQTSGCRHNTIRNCSVNLPLSSTSSSFAGIVSSGSLTSPTSAGGASMYSTIEDNTVIGGYYAVTFYSESSTVPDTGNVVRNNIFQNYYIYGSYFYGQYGMEVSGNDWSRPTRPTVSTHYGIFFTTYGQGLNVTGNRIHEVYGSTTCYGIYFSSVDGTPADPNVVSNNLIYDLRNSSTNYGIYNSGSNEAKYYHNTVILDDQTATSATTYGLYQITTASGIDVRNNIFYIDRSGTGTKRCLYYSNTGTTITSNYNDIVMLSTGGTINATGTWGSTNYNTLLDWQGANSNAFDQNSIDVNPGFYAPTDPTPSAAGAQNLGDPTLGILVDINGTVRPQGSGPDMGAIEFNLPDCPLPSGLTLSNELLFSFDVDWTSGAGNTNYSLEYGPSGFAPGTGTVLAGTLPAMLPMTISGLSAGTAYDVYLTESCTAGTAPGLGPVSIATKGFVNSYPYCATFEGWSQCLPSNCTAGTCNLPDDWLNASGDDGDWSVDAGGTVSSSTGPIVDHTTGTSSGIYLYTESSSPCFNKTLILESPIFDISSMTNDPKLNFAYHMYGQTMGTLSFEYEQPYGSGTWVTLWTRTGEQQSSGPAAWAVDSVYLAVAGSNTRIRVVGTTGSNFYSDMAIDDICMSEAPCQFPIFTATPVCNSADTTYTVDVDVTNLGSGTTLNLDTTTSFGTGLALSGITSTGVYSVGPFMNNSNVTFNLINPAVVGCVFTRSVDGPDCTPPPTNDTCANEDPSLVLIGVGSNVTLNGTTTGATDDAGYISSGFLGSNYEGYVWESFTTTTCTDLIIDLCGTAPAYGNAASFLIPSCGGIPIFRTVGDFSTCGDGNYTAFWNTLPPGTYYYPVLFDAQTNNNGPYQMRIRGFAPQVACTPNTCLEATPLTCGVPVSGTNASNSATQGPSVCLPNHVAPGPDAWYSYTATGNDLITASTCVGTNYNSMLTIYAGAPDCSSLTCITGNDDGCGVAGGASEAKWIATTGTTYYIAVHGPLGFVGATGTFSLQVSCEPACTPQPNDACAGALTITPVLADGLGTPATGSNACAFADANPSCSVSGINAASAQGVWYNFNSGPYGSLFLTLEDDDINPSYTATSLSYALYSGVCGTLVEEACVTAGEGTNTLSGLVSGTEYYLMVYNTGGLGTEGTFGILLEYPAQNDAGITSINTPTGLTCGTVIAPVVVLRNFGEQPLTTVTINYAIDFGTPVSYVWTGNLAFGASVQVTLPSTTVTQGFHFLDVSTNSPNGQVDEVPSNDLQSGTFDASGEEVRVVLNLDNFAGETTWEIYDPFFFVAASGGPYSGLNNTQVVETICLDLLFGNCFSLYIYDSFGDGMCCTYGLGSWEIQNPAGETLLGDVFHGSGLSPDGLPDPGTVGQTPSTTPASASYLAHEFCLPAGPATVLPSECGIFTNTLQSKVYCQAVPGVSDYQFEFSNPDAGFRRRIAVSGRNWVKFSEMVTTPLVPGTYYFTRVRADQGFAGFFDDSFGAGCEMGLDPNQVPGCTQLIDDISLPTHSCNTTKLFGAGDKIYALPTVGATQYRFKFENAGEGFVRVMTRPNYICLLNWTTLPLQVGVTYSVKVEVLVNGQWSGYCGNACNLTIGAPAAQGSASRDISATDDTNSDLLIWPNPVLNGQVNILLSDIADAEQNITIDVIDLFGKRVHAQQFNNSGAVFNTVLELDGLAAGVYVVNMTVNDRVITERITVQ